MEAAVGFESIRSIKDFQQGVELIMRRHNVEFIEAVVMFCEQSGLEIETAGQLIKSSAKLKAIVQQEAENLNYFPKSAKLPVSDD